LLKESKKALFHKKGGGRRHGYVTSLTKGGGISLSDKKVPRLPPPGLDKKNTLRSRREGACPAPEKKRAC